MIAETVWTKEMEFEGRSESGHSVVFDAGDAPPRVFTKIVLTYVIGGAVSKKAAEDAVELSKSKYCSVSKMLEKAAQIDFRIEYASDSSLDVENK
jgi:putative redox protein